jgi:DMATS type aromatic prenyltransferase
MFLAFELGEEMPVVKAYFLPHAKELPAGQSGSSIMFKALHSLAHDRSDWGSLHMLVDSLQMREEASALVPFMIAIDCVAPTKSRMKI